MCLYISDKCCKLELLLDNLDNFNDTNLPTLKQI